MSRSAAIYRYIELNPVRARMAAHPREYPWSSFHVNALGRSDDAVSKKSVMQFAKDFLRAQKDSKDKSRQHFLSSSEMANGAGRWRKQTLGVKCIRPLCSLRAGTLGPDGVILCGWPSAALGGCPCDHLEIGVCFESGGARATRLSRASRRWMWVRIWRIRGGSSAQARTRVGFGRRPRSAGSGAGATFSFAEKSTCGAPWRVPE
jgi:hypothetical protein